MKLSPIEVESRCEILGVEETPIEGGIFRATTCGGTGDGGITTSAMLF